MKNLKVPFLINDVVFTASSDGVDKKVIKAIKVTTDGTFFGFPTKGKGEFYSFLYFSDGFDWYQHTTVFATPEEAMVRMGELKKQKEKEAEKRRLKEIERAKEQVERDKERLEKLEKGETPDESEEEDD